MSWVRCYAAPMDAEAQLVRGFLEGRGVPCLLRPLGPSQYPVATFGTEVLVPAEWQRIAQQLLRRRRRPSRRVVAMPPRKRA